MEQPQWDDGANCRLVRTDGSEWRVTDLRGGEHGLRVDAIRRSAEPVREPSNGSPGSNGSGPGQLKDELLGRGDRLHWLGEDGHVVWSMKLPMDQARSA